MKLLNKEKRILICGGRDYTDSYTFYKTIDSVINQNSDYEITFISGGARGADRLAEDYSEKFMIPIEVYDAEWEKYGKSAGYKRNVRMLVEGKPDLVVAFPGGKGTAMMINLARQSGVEVLEV